MILMDVCTEHDSNGIAGGGAHRRAVARVSHHYHDRHARDHLCRSAREAGVDSFVYKNVGIDELFAVMRSTLAGYCTFLPSESIFGHGGTR